MVREVDRVVFLRVHWHPLLLQSELASLRLITVLMFSQNTNVFLGMFGIPRRIQTQLRRPTSPLSMGNLDKPAPLLPLPCDLILPLTRTRMTMRLLRHFLVLTDQGVLCRLTPISIHGLRAMFPPDQPTMFIRSHSLTSANSQVANGLLPVR